MSAYTFKQTTTHVEILNNGKIIAAAPDMDAAKRIIGYAETPEDPVVKYIRLFLAQPGINIDGICRQSGVSRATLYEILNEKQRLTFPVLKKLAPKLIHYGMANTAVPVEIFRQIVNAAR